MHINSHGNQEKKYISKHTRRVCCEKKRVGVKRMFVGTPIFKGKMDKLRASRDKT